MKPVIKGSAADMLTVDATAFIEAHLRELAREARLGGLAPSRGALIQHYRDRGNEGAVYCLATAPDFSLSLTAGCSSGSSVPAAWSRGRGRNCCKRRRTRTPRSNAAPSPSPAGRSASSR